jgi:hypothetical protein
MRRTLLITALLTALVPVTGTTADAQTQIAPLAPFSGYSTGTAVHVGAIQSGATRVVDTEIAFAGANVNSAGLGAALSNEMTQAYQVAAKAGDKSAARGSGLEIGLTTEQANVTGANQINPGSTMQAFAPASTGLLSKEFLDLNVPPLARASLLRGQAQAIYSDSVCVLGQPISSGLGYAANAQVIPADGATALATSTGNDSVNQSKSFTYLIPNGDGTYGLVTETRQTLAPVVLLNGPTGPLVTLVLAGEWILRSTATGKPGGAKVEYAPGGSPTSTTPVVTLSIAGVPAASLTTQQLLTQKGLVLDIPTLGQIVIGEDPRAIAGNADSTPELASNGTVAAGAVDVVRITAALGSTLGLADLRVGHMESKAVVPAGGIKCGIPVSKTGTPASVVAGQNQTVNYTITVPSDIEAFKAVACDLVNIKVVDVTTAEPGVKFEIVSASRNGVISGGTVTWENLGTYKHGDPAIVLTIGLKVPASSAAGKINDTATATGALANCKGNESATAASLTGLATLEAAALSGTAILGSSTTSPGGTAVVLPAVANPVGPTPRGGVATGAGGMSEAPDRMLPIGAALASIMLVGFLTTRRRRWIG